jgi:hypothetical protein
MGLGRRNLGLVESFLSGGIVGQLFQMFGDMCGSALKRDPTDKTLWD